MLRQDLISTFVNKVSENSKFRLCESMNSKLTSVCLLVNLFYSVKLSVYLHGNESNTWKHNMATQHRINIESTFQYRFSIDRLINERCLSARMDYEPLYWKA